MSEDCQKVLIVAYHFPPSAAVGALRPQKFVKYLPEFCWEPHVLTIREEFAESLDIGRMEDVKGVNIVRTDFWRSPLSFFLATKVKLKKCFSIKNSGMQSSLETPKGFPASRTIKERFKHTIWEVNTFPDASLYWSLSAVFAGVQLIREKKISCIYATIPQPTAALIGYFLSLLTGVSLVLDFRDPWSGARFPGDWRSGLYDKIEAWVERLTIRRACRVICTNDRFRQQLQEIYSDFAAEKFVTIANGYDAGGNLGPLERKEKDRFVISYLGTFYLDRNPETFFSALKTGIADGSLPEQGIEVRLFGQVELVGVKKTLDIVRACGLDNIVKIVGQVPHHEALRQMQNSDLLLLLAPNQPEQIPAKAFEYIGARRPILTLTEDGATADLIRETHAGLVVRQNDQVGILNALQDILRFHHAGKNPWYHGSDVSKFERRNLTSELAIVLNDAVRLGKSCGKCVI